VAGGEKAIQRTFFRDLQAVMSETWWSLVENGVTTRRAAFFPLLKALSAFFPPFLFFQTCDCEDPFPGETDAGKVLLSFFILASVRTDRLGERPLPSLCRHLRWVL